MNAASQHGAEVGGAGAEESEALAPAEGVALLLDEGLDLRMYRTHHYDQLSPTIKPHAV